MNFPARQEAFLCSLLSPQLIEYKWLYNQITFILFYSILFERRERKKRTVQQVVSWFIYWSEWNAPSRTLAPLSRKFGTQTQMHTTLLNNTLFKYNIYVRACVLEQQHTSEERILFLLFFFLFWPVDFGRKTNGKAWSSRQSWKGKENKKNNGLDMARKRWPDFDKHM